MPRRAARVDANQDRIVKALRDVGADVLHLHAVGKGCPDILVYWRGYYLIEIKDGSKPPSARQLTDDQVKFHDEWNGPIFVVCSAHEALSVIGAQ